MKPRVAFEYELVMSGAGEPDTSDSDAPDFFRKFIESGELASRIGWRDVARFEESTADIDRRANEIFQKTHATPTSDEWDEDLTTGAPLEKRFSGVSESGYRNWLRAEV